MPVLYDVWREGAANMPGRKIKAVETHSSRWERYSSLPDAEKKAQKKTIQKYFGRRATLKFFSVDSGIVNVLIGDLLFYHDDGKSRAIALGCFEYLNDESDDAGDSNFSSASSTVSRFQVKVANVMQFELDTSYQGVGMIFRMAQGVLELTN
eukprot:IDg2175t1